MATVFIPAPLRSLTGGVQHVDIAGSSLGELIAALEERFPGIGARLAEGDALADGLAVSVDANIHAGRSLSTRVGPSSEVHFGPAIGGG